MVSVTLPSACNFPSWTRKSQNRWVSGAIRKEGPKKFFRDPGFPFFEARDSGFESKIGKSLGIESMLGRCDAKNNPRDHGTARNFGSGLRD